MYTIVVNWRKKCHAQKVLDIEPHLHRYVIDIKHKTVRTQHSVSALEGN